MKHKDKEPFQRISLDPSDDGVMLERALKKKLTEWSWGDIRGAIRGRRVQVNGNLCMDGLRKVTPRDAIKVWNDPLPKPVEAEDLKLVYVDEFLVVVEKPPGITSVRHFEERNLSPKRRQIQPTLEELLPRALMRHYHPEGARKSATRRDVRVNRSEVQKIEAARLKRYQVIAVHRLDRDTSGLMIFARTPSVAQSFGKAFKNHRVVRRYHAIVHGHPAEQTFDSILVRDRGDGHRGTKPADRGEDPTEQRAITHIRPVERIGEYALVECELETGRTHQIRIHLAEAGHVLCGDAIYCKNKEGRLFPDRSGAPRQALHSATLAFEHPISGERLEFKMPWPADLHRWLQKLRKDAAKPTESDEGGDVAT